MRLPLHHCHQKLDAHFAEFGDWELPKHYGHPLSEYGAAREAVGLADLSHQGTLLLSGQDRLGFLQNLTSNDLELLTENTGIRSCLLMAKGKVVSDFHLYALQKGLSSETLLLDIESNNLDRTKNQLMRYRMRSRVEMIVPEWGRLLVSGPKATTLLASYLDTPFPVLAEKSFFQRKIGQTELLCIKRSMVGTSDYHLYVRSDEIEALWNDLLKAGRSLSIAPIGQDVLECLRIEAGQPRYGFDIDDDILPIEAGLEAEVISYTKGCYPGQEVMARIKTYGHINKQLTGLLLAGDVLAHKGAQVFQGKKEIGAVTSTVHSPHLEGVIAMAYLKTSAASPGTVLEVEIKGIRTEAKVFALPFYKAEM